MVTKHSTLTPARLSVLWLLPFLCTCVIASCAAPPPRKQVSPAPGRPAPYPTATEAGALDTTAAPGADPEGYAVAGELRLAVRENIRSLNPFVTSNDSEEFVTRMIYDSLLNYQPGSGFSPNLAERWEFSGDGTKLTVWLNAQARWHDGTQVTASDVVLTYDLIRGGLLPGWASIAAAVHRAEAISPREVQLTLLDTSEEVVQQVCARVPVVPAALWQTISEPATYANLENPVGSGPFVLESYKEGERLVLRNSERHPTRAPTMATLVVEIIRDETKALQALTDGQVDALGWDALPAMVADVRDHADTYPGVLWTAVPGASQRVILLNLRRSPYDDSRLRTVLAEAVDVASIIRQATFDLAEPASADPFAPSSEWRDAASPVPSYNPEAAKQALEDAGYHDVNGDGIRELPDGTALLIPITCAKVETEQKIVSMIMTNWKAVGIAAKAVPVAPEQVLPAMMGGSFEAVLTELALIVPSSVYDWFHSSQGEITGGLVVGKNYGGYASAAFDRTAELLLEARDPATRLSLCREAQQPLAGDAPWLPLFSPWVLSLYSEARFAGWDPTPGVGLLDRYVLTRLVARD